jgi:predicted DNA-binding ribbon-helix-helix protein
MQVLDKIPIDSDAAIVDDEQYVLQVAALIERIAFDHNQVGFQASFDRVCALRQAEAFSPMRWS